MKKNKGMPTRTIVVFCCVIVAPLVFGGGYGVVAVCVMVRNDMKAAEAERAREAKQIEAENLAFAQAKQDYEEERAKAVTDAYARYEARRLDYQPYVATGPRITLPEQREYQEKKAMEAGIKV